MSLVNRETQVGYGTSDTKPARFRSANMRVGVFGKLYLAVTLHLRALYPALGYPR